jgi:hypothetical protein
MKPNSQPLVCWPGIGPFVPSFQIYIFEKALRYSITHKYSAEVCGMEKYSEWSIGSDVVFFAALFIGAFVFFFILPRVVKKFKKTENAPPTKK